MYSFDYARIFYASSLHWYIRRHVTNKNVTNVYYSIARVMKRAGNVCNFNAAICRAGNTFADNREQTQIFQMFNGGLSRHRAHNVSLFKRLCVLERRSNYPARILRTQPGAYFWCYRLGNTPRGAVLRTISAAINYVPRVFFHVDPQRREAKRRYETRLKKMSVRKVVAPDRRERQKKQKTRERGHYI